MTEPARRRAAALLLTALTSLAVPAPLLGQSTEPDARRLAQESVYRRAALRLERERELIEYWAELGEFDRRELERRVAAERDPRRARFEGVTLQGYARALRQGMHPTDDGPLEAWFDLVDSVDLVVVPGVFAARDEGRGEPMTVTIEALWDSEVDQRDDEDVEVALLWIAPDGTELTARQEPAGVRALETGFEMYVRPPESGPGVWSLVLEVRTSDGVVRSQGVDVECVEDLAELRARLASAASVAGRVLRERLEALTGSGLRRFGGSTLASWIAAESGDVPPPALLVTRDAATGAALPAHWVLTEAEDSTRVVVVLTAGLEHPLDLLTGPSGAAWRAFAAADDRRVVAARSLVVGREVGALQDLVRGLRAGGAEEVVVVARGDAGRVLPGALARAPLPGLSGLVLAETPGAYAPVRPEVPVPCLRVETGAEGEAYEELGDASGPRRTRATLTAPLPFAAPAVPGLVRRWLSAR